MLLLYLLCLFQTSTESVKHIFVYDHKTQKVTPHPDNASTTEEIGYFNMTFGHAESPRWDPDSEILYWVDVLNQTVHSLNYKTFKHHVRHLDCGEVNVVIPILNSSQLLIGCQSKVFVMDWSTSKLTEIAHLDLNKPHNVFNEGQCDARGRLWAGTKGPQTGETVKFEYAALYKMEVPCYIPELQLESVTISNGLVWSLNNSLMYYIDSATNKIDAMQYDLQTGRIDKRRTILDTKQWGYKNPTPDGMTIDRDGFLWIALLHYGQIIRVNPDNGVIVSVYDLPVPRVTSVRWIGAALEELVITTSQRNLSPEELDAAPLAGSIFVLSGLPTGGVPEYKCVYNPPTLITTFNC